MTDLGTLLRGSKTRAPDWLELRAGPLTMSFDPENLSIRLIRLGDREVLRSIYGAIRDRDWGTTPPRVSNLRLDTSERAFRLEFDAECCQAEIDFAWKGTVIGEADGSVRFVFDGKARSSFMRSRIGLCVLHPLAECAGKVCEVEHADGTRENATFPAMVSPWQPLSTSARAHAPGVARPESGGPIHW